MPGSPLSTPGASFNPEESLANLIKACELAPEASKPFILLANFLFAQKKYAEARAHFEKAVINADLLKARAKTMFFSSRSRSPEEQFVYLQTCNEASRDSIFACSQILACERLFSQAQPRSKIETAEVQIKGEGPASERLTKLYLQATKLLEAKKYSAALYNLEKIISIFTSLVPSDEAKIIFLMANAYKRQGRISLARQAYKQVIELSHAEVRRSSRGSK